LVFSVCGINGAAGVSPTGSPFEVCVRTSRCVRRTEFRNIPSEQ